MKKLDKLKLNQLSKAELEKREMNHLLGGGTYCSCGCHYEGSGGSSSADNSRANWQNGYTSPGGGTVVTCSCYLSHGEAVSNDTARPK